MRDEAEAWRAESEAAEQRARDLEALATMARTRLHDMEPSKQGEILGLLDVRVTITGPVPARTTNPGCTLTRRFADNERPAPPLLTDETWAKVEPVIRAWEPPNHRLVPGRPILDAIFYKARTGCGWHSVPTPEGLNWKTVHTRFNRWMRAGVFDEVMKRLPNEGTPPGTVVQLPPLEIEGRVDPRMRDIRHDADHDETSVTGSTSSSSAAVQRSALASG